MLSAINITSMCTNRDFKCVKKHDDWMITDRKTSSRRQLLPILYISLEARGWTTKWEFILTPTMISDRKSTVIGKSNLNYKL